MITTTRAAIEREIRWHRERRTAEELALMIELLSAPLAPHEGNGKATPRSEFADLVAAARGGRLDQEVDARLARRVRPANLARRLSAAAAELDLDAYGFASPGFAAHPAYGEHARRRAEACRAVMRRVLSLGEQRAAA
jgi:hypothetical protein